MIYFATTFNEEMYYATGRTLIRSFAEHCNGHKLYVGSESFYLMKQPEIVDYPYDESHELLAEFLKQNEDIIPQKYGGKYPLCGPKCPDPNNMWRGHKRNCLNGGFNSRTFCWLRKFVILGAVKNLLGPDDILFYLDSDIEVKADINAEHIESLFKDTDCVYHLGRHRVNHKLPIETGIIGFRGQGLEFIDIAIKMYRTGKFKKLPEWSDSHVFQHVIFNSDIKSRDLIKEKGFIPQSNVVPYSPLGEYFVHHKGSHGYKKHGIVV